MDKFFLTLCAIALGYIAYEISKVFDKRNKRKRKEKEEQEQLERAAQVKNEKDQLDKIKMQRLSILDVLTSASQHFKSLTSSFIFSKVQDKFENEAEFRLCLMGLLDDGIIKNPDSDRYQL